MTRAQYLDCILQPVNWPETEYDFQAAMCDALDEFVPGIPHLEEHARAERWLA
jgi:hypothetical protein